MAPKKKAPPTTVLIVEQGGFQYSVAQGDILKVPSIDAKEGDEITIDKVLMVRDGDSIKIGTPCIKGASATAKVLEHAKYDKILIMKKKRRKNYKRKTGHRQPFTKIQITAVSV